MIWALLLLTTSATPAKHETRVIIGKLNFFHYCYIQVDIPDVPLVTLDVSIHVENPNTYMGEYSNPKPVGYASFDKYPTETDYDFIAELDKGTELVNTIFPSFFRTLYIRIDGGLNWNNHLMQAYTILRLQYEVVIELRYCESGFYTVTQPVNRNSISCSLLLHNADAMSLENINVFDIYLAGVFNVPYYSELLYVKLSGGRMLVRPGNMPIKGSDELTTGVTEFKMPKAGLWYVLVKVPSGKAVQLSTSVKPCFAGLFISCLSKPVYRLNSGEHYYTYSAASVQKPLFISKPTDPLVPSYPFKYFSFEHERVGSQVSLQFVFYNKGPFTSDLSELFRNYFTLYTSSGCPATSENSRKVINGFNRTMIRVTDQRVTVDIELGYMSQGLQFFTLSLASSTKDYYFSFEVSVFTSDCGQDMCSGDSCVSEFGTFVCMCTQNNVGLHCEGKAFSNASYLTMVVTLCVSNFSMLPAVWVSWSYHAYGEMTVFLCNMIASAVYHVCDTEFYCFEVNPENLRLVDFIFSYFSILVSIVYLAKLKDIQVKLMVYVFLIFFLISAGLESRFAEFSTKYVPPLLAGGVTISRYIKLIIGFNIHHGLSLLNLRTASHFLLNHRNFDFRWGVAAMISFVTALLCNVFETNTFYWLNHSAWHVFVMFSAMCIIKTLPADSHDKEFILAYDSTEDQEFALKDLSPITASKVI